MFAAMEIDWPWVAGVVTAGLGAWNIRLQADITELKRQVAKFVKREQLFTLPYPSDGSEEEEQIRLARELSRKKGIKLSMADAAMVIEQVKASRERKKASKESS